MAGRETSGREVAPGWVSVYFGPLEALRLIESRLQALEIPYQRLAGQNSLGEGGVEIHSPLMLEFRLVVPTSVLQERRGDIEAAILQGGWDGTSAGDLAAIAEAEEDYDVRACPACLLYLHEVFSHCPGCGARLVPAVEIFEEGQAEPDRVIMRVGPPEEVKGRSRILEAAGFHAEAFEVDGWAVAAVDLPWRELLDRTREAERLLS